MHLLRRSSRSGSRSSEIEKRRWGVAGFIQYITKLNDLLLSPAEVGRLFDTFEEATRGDLQRKANVCVFVATFKRKCIEGKDLTFTNMLAVSKELDKLIELEECVTWPVMVEKIENHTRLRLMVNRPEVERRITSVAKVSTQSSAPRNEYQSLLERSGTWEPPKHSPVTSSSWLRDLRSLSAQALEGRTILTPTVDTCSVTTIARIDNLMEKAAASPAIPKDDMLATTDDDDEEEEEEEEMELVVQEDAAADKISSGIAQRLVVLSQEQREEARRWLGGPADEKVLTEKYAIPITRSKLSALRPNTWLNDEIINFYMGLLQDRDAELCKNNPSRNSSHYFNSFFMNKVLDENDKRVYTYSAVRRWTKKFDIFTKRRIYFPINISNTHWTHLVLYIEAREIHYYDSMGGNGEKYMRAILKWVVDEARDKKAIDNYDVSDFRLIDHGHNIPQQENGYDCGVFSCMFADFDTDDLPFQFSQENLADFRLKIVLAIMRGELLYQ